MKLIMTIDDKIRDEKLQYDINRDAAKMSALSSGEIDNMSIKETNDKEILPPDQSRLIEQAKFTYSSLGKAFKKQIKTIEDQGEKQVEVLKVLKPVEHQQKMESIEGIFPKDLDSS